MKVEKREDASAEYHSSAPVSRTKLFRMMKNGQVCPKNYKYLLENPPDQTEALLFGRAFHKAVLEPDDFDKEFAVAPVCDRRTKQGKDIWNEFQESAKGKDVISDEMNKAILGMKESILSDTYARMLVSGEVERSYYWTDDLTGIECKCRPDVRFERRNAAIIVDLKSTTNASTDYFSKECMKLGYDLQAAMYKQGVDDFYSKKHSFVFIAVEKTPPYALNVLEADEFFIKKGQALYRELLGTLKYCMDTDDWYGYGGAKELGGINDLTLPAYMLKDFE